MTDRIQTIRDMLTSQNLDAILVSSYANVSYISNYFGFSALERDAYILISRENTSILTNSLYKDAIKKLVPHMTLFISTVDTPFSKNLHAIFKDESMETIGFESDNLTVSEFQKIREKSVRFIPISLKNIRMHKSGDEIMHIKKACELTDQAYEYISNSKILPGITEKELASRLELFIKQHGADVSFRTIVAFGKNAAVPHHLTSNTKLKKNDLILIDFGVKLNNYCSDMTRTFFIGEPTQEQKKAYQTVLNAQVKAIEYLDKTLSSSSELSESRSNTNNSSRQSSNSNIAAASVDKAARDYIVSLGFPTIPHSLGHGIGIEVHEAPSLSPYSEDIVEEGMVFSIEPGIYLTNKFGIRIEDLFAIQSGKLIQLTQSPNSQF